jgi:hypothetical protein
MSLFILSVLKKSSGGSFLLRKAMEQTSAFFSRRLLRLYRERSCFVCPKEADLCRIVTYIYQSPHVRVCSNNRMYINASLFAHLMNTQRTNTQRTSEHFNLWLAELERVPLAESS